MSHAQYPLEGLPELRVEDGVDERVYAAVDVAEPGGKDEGGVAGAPRALGLDADGVQHVAGEERNPAHQEEACMWGRGNKFEF